MPRVVVVGGGITGLAAAYYLKKRDPSLGLTLVEPGPWGGKIKTERADGFLLEAGPDSFITQKPWALELCRELGLGAELTPADSRMRRTYVLHRGELVEIPEGLFLLAPTQLGPFLRSPLLSWGGKLRAGLEVLVPSRPPEEDESIASYIIRRFGRELYERLAEPLLSGIYAGDCRELSLKSTFPLLAELEKSGSVIRGLRARARKGSEGAEPAVFMTLREGMGRLAGALQSRLPPKSMLQGKVTEVFRVGSGLEAALSSGEKLHADALILAVPAYEAAEILKRSSPDLAEALLSIPYSSVATVSLGYRGLSAPQGFGFVVPKTERRRLLACTWSSSKYPFRAPEGDVLLRAYLGGEEWVSRGDQDLIEAVREELRAIMGLREGPVLARAARWPRAMPQYRVGHSSLLERLEKLAAGQPGLVLAGSAYRGVGLPDCVRSAGEACGSVLSRLGGEPGRHVV